MRKIMCFAIIFMMFFSVVLAHAAETEGDFRGIHWKFEKGILSFTGSGVVDGEGPWTAYKRNAKTLSFSGEDLHVYASFSGYKNVSTVILGKGVVYTGMYVFRDMGKKLKLAVESNDYIWDCESYDTATIAKIELGEGVDNYVIDDCFVLNKEKDRLLMFYGKKKDKLIIPETVKYLSKSVLAEKEMKELILPQGLEVIEDDALCYCPNLQKLTIPASVQKIGSFVFAGCKKLKELYFINTNVEWSTNESPDHWHELNSITDLFIPNYGDLSEISIYNCKNLYTIVISEGNTKMAGYNGIIGLDPCAIFIPKSMKEIAVRNIPYSTGVKLYVYLGSYGQKFAEDNDYNYVIVNPIKRVILSHDSIEMREKKTITLTAEIEPKDATWKKVQWISTNEQVATVQEGKVKAIGEGECDIICRGFDCGGVTAVCHVIVTK